MTIESIDRDIKRLQEQMNDKSHISQSVGQDSTKLLQKLTDLYSKRRKIQNDV